MIVWLLGSFVVMMILGVPIGFCLGISAIGGILFFDQGSIVTVCQRIFEGMNSWALLAIPLYTFAGYTMSRVEFPSGLWTSAILLSVISMADLLM